MRAVVRWSCYVTTTVCPMPDCEEEESIDHLILECPRTQVVWDQLKSIGLPIAIDQNSICYGLMPNVEETQKDICFLIIGITLRQIWKTRCRMTIDGLYVTGQTVYKQIITEMKRRRTLDIKKGEEQKWNFLTF